MALGCLLSSHPWAGKGAKPCAMMISQGLGPSPSPQPTMSHSTLVFKPPSVPGSVSGTKVKEMGQVGPRSPAPTPMWQGGFLSCCQCLWQGDPGWWWTEGEIMLAPKEGSQGRRCSAASRGGNNLSPLQSDDGSSWRRHGGKIREPSTGGGGRAHHSSAPTASLRHLLLPPSSMRQELGISTR